MALNRAESNGQVFSQKTKMLILQGFDGVTRVCEEVCRVCKTERDEGKKSLESNRTFLHFWGKAVPLAVPQGIVGF